jgi:1-deoxy-D-xylulose-5-phosphate reductoisomerase
LPAVLNAANETAVNAFVEGRISFPEISGTVARVMDRHAVVARPRLEQILEADAWARQEAS